MSNDTQYVNELAELLRESGLRIDDIRMRDVDSPVATRLKIDAYIVDTSALESVKQEREL